MPPDAVAGLRGAALRFRGLLVPVLVVSLVLVLVIPVPAAVLDVLLTASIAFSVLVLLTTIYVARPLDFSVFPTILLSATLARLVLNFASTRLILSRAAIDGTRAGGGVIETFGNFVTGGQVTVGLILFTILVVVQFVVITRGSARISEVAARFTLDAMPGRQMAIDADVSAGLITREQAQNRRAELESQSDFYAAMDGAGKFVHGDAIAGIVITLTNIGGGFYVGMVVHGMSLDRAVEVFTRLTIGDGLVTQVPALLISLAAGLIVTRSSSDRHLPRAMISQLFGHAESLFLAAAFLITLALTGLPVAPLLALAGLCLSIGIGLKRAARPQVESTEVREPATSNEPEPGAATDLSPFVEPLELELGANLLGLAHGHRLIDRIRELRRRLARELGCLLPDVVIRDNLSLGSQQYQLCLRGTPVARGRLLPDHWLILNGDTTTDNPAPAGAMLDHDPVSGRRGWWIDHPGDGSSGQIVLEPVGLLLRHLDHVVRRHAAELLTRQQVHHLLDQLAGRAPRLVDELIPELVSTSQLHRVLGNLLAEQVTIRDLETILETLGDHAGTTDDPGQLTELVRARLSRAICQQYRDDQRRLQVLTLAPELEEHIEESSKFSVNGVQSWLAAGLTDQLLETITDHLDTVDDAGPQPVILCSSPLARAAFKQLSHDRCPQLVAMSLEEISRDTQVESLGQIQVPLSTPHLQAA